MQIQNLKSQNRLVNTKGYRQIKAENFPKPIRISAGISAIRNSDLIKYAADPANYKSEEQA